MNLRYTIRRLYSHVNISVLLKPRRHLNDASSRNIVTFSTASSFYNRFSLFKYPSFYVLLLVFCPMAVMYVSSSNSANILTKYILDASAEKVLDEDIINVEIKSLQKRAKERDVKSAFVLGRKLGEGTYSKVYEGKHISTSHSVAIKVVSKKYTSYEMFWKEVFILLSLGKHPNVLELVDVFESDTHYYLVTDLVGGGELFDVLVRQGAYSEKHASDLLRQVSAALCHLHMKGIAHADIKPENLLLMDPSNVRAGVKLVDFGLSSFGCTTVKQHISSEADMPGTYAYWAPEQFQSRQFGVCSDIWSFGVLMYIVLYGFHPFDPDGTATDDQLKCNILAGKWEMNKNIPISEQASHLLRSCLHPDPALRLTTEELVNHPWITGELQLSDKPLDDSHKLLMNYHNMRRKLKGRILALLFHNRKQLKPRPSILSQEAVKDLTVDETALSHTLKAFDPDKKGYISSTDVMRALTMALNEATDMVTAIGSRPDSGLSYDDVAALLGSVQKVSVNMGDTVFKEGDIDDGFYIILNGEVEVTCHSREAGNKVIGRMGTGDFFGETEMMYDPISVSSISELRRNSLKRAGLIESDSSTEPRISTITVVSHECELMRLTRADFESLTSESNKAAQVLQNAALKQSHMVFLSLLADAVVGMNTTILKEGEALFNEGDVATKVYIIKEGTLEVTKKGHSGQEVVLKDLEKGAYVGEMALIQNRLRNASVTCRTMSVQGREGGCKVTEISKESFLKVLSNRSVAESLRDVVRKKQAENEKLLHDLST